MNDATLANGVKPEDLDLEWQELVIVRTHVQDGQLQKQMIKERCYTRGTPPVAFPRYEVHLNYQQQTVNQNGQVLSAAGDAWIPVQARSREEAWEQIGEAKKMLEEHMNRKKIFTAGTSDPSKAVEELLRNRAAGK